MNVLNLFNQNSPESVLGHKLLVSTQVLDPSVNIVNSTHGNVVKKHPGVQFSVINVIGVDIPERTIKWLIEHSPDAKIITYRDANSNVEEWSSSIKAITLDMFEKYGDISPCQQVLAECKLIPEWLATLTPDVQDATEEHVYATAHHFRFTRTSENFRNRIVEGFGDEKEARKMIGSNLCFKDKIAVCNVTKTQSWEVARFLSFSHPVFMLYEDGSNKRIFWTYGLSREYIKKKFQPENVWSHGVMLSFSLPKSALPH